MFNFDGSKLQEAIFETLQNRGTIFEESTFSNVIDFDKSPDMQKKWRDFLRRLKLPFIEFTEVLSVLDYFLSPVWYAMVREEKIYETWEATSHSWR